MRSHLALLLAAIPMSSCLGTTGYTLVSFNAAAAGPADADPSHPFAFTSDHGYHVVLTRAVLHVGALYLDQSIPSSGGGDTTCTLPGQYVGELRGGIDIDMLSPKHQPFPGQGTGSTQAAAVGQVWLTGGDVNAIDDPTNILSVAGSAEKDGKTIPFTGTITIGKNRNPGTVGTALPGANPICKQRVVTPILTSLTLSEGGTLVLRVDPRALFTNVDFSALKRFSEDPPSYGFVDSSDDQPSINLYQNLRAAGAVYRFEWTSATP